MPCQVHSISVSPDEIMFLTKSLDPKLIKYDLRHIGSIKVELTSNAPGAARVGTSPVLYLGGAAVSPDEMMFLTKSPGPKLMKYDLKHVWIIIVGFT